MQERQVSAEEVERKRVDAVVGTIAGMKRRSGTLAEVAHDARNMVTALSLYCDLLSEQGALTPQCVHYASELRLIAAASRRLVEKLLLLDMEESAGEDIEGRRFAKSLPTVIQPQSTRLLPMRLPNDLIDNLQQELLANRNLLDALTGLGIAISVRVEGGAHPVQLTSEDFTRVLINLVKNAAEALHGAGTVAITLRETGLEGDVAVLCVEDNGPGIPEELGQKIFESNCTTHGKSTNWVPQVGWPVTHRGLGLAITRSIVEAAGGSIAAANCPQGGACFEIQLPVRTR
jgi:signal transduction histidine kinase